MTGDSSYSFLAFLSTVLNGVMAPFFTITKKKNEKNQTYPCFIVPRAMSGQTMQSNEVVVVVMLDVWRSDNSTLYLALACCLLLKVLSETVQVVW